MIILKSCPWCAADMFVVPAGGDYNSGKWQVHGVHAPNCICNKITWRKFYDSPESAANAWNGMKADA